MNQTAEFTLTDIPTSDRRSPARWVLSHALRHWPIGPLRRCR